MITIEKCRKLLGEKAKNCTNDEVKAVRDWLEQLAIILIETKKKKAL